MTQNRKEKLKKEIVRHKANMKNTEIRIKQDIHKHLAECCMAELKGIETAEKEFADWLEKTFPYSEKGGNYIENGVITIRNKIKELREGKR